MNIGTNEQSTAISEGVLVVTNEHYEQMKADGVDDETLLKPGTYKLRRRYKTAPDKKLQPSNIKVEFLIKLDSDVLNYFKERAGETDATALQTLINQELRQIMEREQKAQTEETAARLLENKNFIAALAAELKKAA